MTLQPMTATMLVGRDADVSVLKEHRHAAVRGAGSTVLIGGEAGIGKSRLIAEISRDLTRAAPSADDTMLPLRGHCFEHDRGLPYAPILDLLRSWSLHTTPDDLAAYLGTDAVIFGALLPELAGPSPAPEQEKHRIIQALLGLFTRLARGQSLLIIVEDLHWSDDASMEFLLHLARHVSALPILLLLTYRSDEVTPSLQHILALLDRERLAAEIALSRLALADVDAMLRAIFEQPQPIRTDFLHAIHDLTDGNPFFIEEVVRSLIASGDIFHTGGRWERRSLAQLRIPRSVQDAVMRRAGHLSADAIAVLNIAAVAGRIFDFTVLQSLTHHDEPTFLELIRALVSVQLVEEQSAERFAFRHALTRQAIYAAMLARERRALHLAVAEAMERLHAAMLEPYFADLSYHFAAGEAWEKAINYGERAGARALALYAPHAAVDHFSRAIDAAARLGIAPSVRLSRERGRALLMLGEFDRALADYQVALHRAQATGDRRAEWQALLDLGGLWAGYDYARAGEHFEQALALARIIERPDAIAESLTQLGSWYLNTERTDEAEASLQAALAIFEEAGDRRGIARSIDLLGTVSDIAGDIMQMRRRYERAAAAFRALDDRQGLCSTLATMLIAGGAYIFETVVVPQYISVPDSMRESEEALTLARDIGWRAGEAYVLLNQTMNLGSHGEYGRALSCARDALAIAHEIDHHEWMAGAEWIHGVIFMEVLALPRAQEHFARAQPLAHESGSLHWIHLMAGYTAEVRVMQGDSDGAENILASFAPNLPMRTLGQRRVWLTRAKIALRRGDASGALDIVERLFANAVNLTGKHDIPMLALLHGECLMALKRHDEAVVLFRAALSIVTDRGLPGLRWRLHLVLGQCCTAQHLPADAGAQFQAAWEIIQQLAATLSDDPLRDTFLMRAEAMFPTNAAVRARRERSMLTGRERDVAMLVARGRSNREIADALSIGERTVETHVGNILNKLGFSSRVQIAAWAVESKLGRGST